MAGKSKPAKFITSTGKQTNMASWQWLGSTPEKPVGSWPACPFHFNITGTVGHIWIWEFSKVFIYHITTRSKNITVKDGAFFLGIRKFALMCLTRFKWFSWVFTLLKKFKGEKKVFQGVISEGETRANSSDSTHHSSIDYSLGLPEGLDLEPRCSAASMLTAYIILENQ